MSDIPAGPPGEEDLDLGEIVDDLEPEPDEPEPEAEDEEPPEVDGEEPPEPVAQPRQGRRGQAERLRIKTDRLERELAELKARPAPVAQPAIDPGAAQRAEAEKWERRAMMSPVEIAQDVAREFEGRMQQSLAMQQFTTQDLVDKQQYDAEARTSRVHQQYKQRVDTLLSSERARGNLGATRGAILAYLVGQDAIERANRAAPRQQRAAAGRVSRQQVRPGSTRSDGAAGSRTRPDADEALLRGIRVGDL